MNLELITKQVTNISRSVGNFLRSEVRKVQFSDIENKGQNNFVTYVDKTAEERLVEELRKVLPGAGFIAEENSGLQKQDTYNWIIDPLDGTTNFIHKVPLYSISIALMEHDKVISGVVYEANLQECFYAWLRGGAYLNGHRISVSGATRLKDSLFATGFPYHDYGRLNEYLQLFKYLMQHSHGLRRLGTAAVDLAYTACGRFDGFYEYGLSPWDVAGGAILVTEAGGKICDFSGTDDFIFGKEVMASNPGIFSEFLEVVKTHFPERL
jgi:myo-inositol-1(or 4)-monophosphatase